MPNPTPVLRYRWTYDEPLNLKEEIDVYQNVKTLPDDCLAKEIVEVQESSNFPGLVQECQDFLAKAGINNVTSFSKQQWKVKGSKIISKANEVELAERIKGY